MKPTVRPIIAEPATSLTDLVLVAQTLTYASQLRKGPARTERPGALWALTMTAVGIAALAGAITHALHEDSSLHRIVVVRSVAWKVVGLSTAAASAFLLAAGIFSAILPGRRAPFLVATAIKAAMFAAASVITGNFLFTILDYAVSMLIVLYFQLRNWKSSLAAPWLTGGILVSFVAATIQRSNISLHTHFNHNDIYHVVQMAAFHLLYLGARRQQDRTDKGQ